MVQVLDPSMKQRFASQFAQSLGGNIGQGLSEGFSDKIQQRKLSKAQSQEDEALERMGLNLRGVTDPKTRQLLISEMLKSGASQQKSQLQNQQKLAPYQAALGTINRMRQIGEGGNLGIGSKLAGGIFGGERARDVGEYEQLGKSLISMASSIPIRNQKEFETLAHDLYDPTIRDEKRAGILDAMEKIISDSIEAQGGFQEMEMQQESQRKEPRYDKKTGNIMIESPDGKKGFVSPENLEMALSKGYKLR